MFVWVKEGGEVRVLDPTPSPHLTAWNDLLYVASTHQVSLPIQYDGLGCVCCGSGCWSLRAFGMMTRTFTRSQGMPAPPGCRACALHWIRGWHVSAPRRCVLRARFGRLIVHVQLLRVTDVAFRFVVLSCNHTCACYLSVRHCAGGGGDVQLQAGFRNPRRARCGACTRRPLRAGGDGRHGAGCIS